VTSPKTARRGPGRPPRLSREAIVDAALALLEREPEEKLGVARIAAQVDAVPAALYRHFDGLDDLLDSVLARVLGGARLESEGDAAWPEQVRAWMTSLRAHLLRYPAVLPLIGRRGRTSPAWLDAMDVLLRILERSGLSGARLATAHLWIAETTIGLVMQEASLPLPDQIEAARLSLAELSAGARARLAPLVPHLASLDGDAFFAFVTERTIAALEDLVRAR
jgi:AcrR family transcriptional regulator